MTKTLKATHMGDLNLGGIEIPCAVLEDGTRVLSERAVSKILKVRAGGRAYAQKKSSDGAAGLPVFVGAKRLMPFIDEELTVALVSPIEYTPTHGGRNALGIKAGLLPQVCNVWLSAREHGVLTKQQAHIAQAAEVLMRGLAHVGIIALVDEATGYQDVRGRADLERILRDFIDDELNKWQKTFPDDYYKEMFRLRGWPYLELNEKRPGVVGHLTNDIVYGRLAPGVLSELKRLNPTKAGGRRKAKHHQLLTTDKGHPRLKEHLAGVVMLMKASKTWNGFMKALDRVSPKYGSNFELELPGLEPGTDIENEG